MASTGSVDGWPLGPTELGEAGLSIIAPAYAGEFELHRT